MKSYNKEPSKEEIIQKLRDNKILLEQLKSVGFCQLDGFCLGLDKKTGKIILLSKGNDKNSLLLTQFQKTMGQFLDEQGAGKIASLISQIISSDQN
ncbi:MAG: hypothetical protein K0S74_219 [Chlamydiales bacterium]|jgi:hypothetical protein|nr:hypothetical protein [Chlamydiales bacterium]